MTTSDWNALGIALDDAGKFSVATPPPTAAAASESTRLTFAVPTKSTLLSLGAVTEHDFHGWEGTWQGVTMGTKGTIGLAAGHGVTIVSAKLDGQSHSTHKVAEEAVEGAETMVKAHEWAGVALGAAEFAFFAGPTVGTALSGLMWAQGLHFMILGATHALPGMAMMHGEAEALVTSRNTVVSAAGRKNAVVGGALAELSSGMVSEVKGVYAAEVKALGAAELRAIGKVEVLANYSAELIARQGTAEVLGKAIEIGKINNPEETRQADTEWVEVHANKLIELSAKSGHDHAVLEVAPKRVEAEVGHNGLSITDEGVVALTHHAGLRVSNDKIELAYLPHPTAADLAAARTERDDDLDKAEIAALEAQAIAGAALVAAVAAESIGAGAQGTDITAAMMTAEGLALAAAAATSVVQRAKGMVSAGVNATFMAASTAAKNTADTATWLNATGDLSSNPQVVVENGKVTAKVGAGKLTVEDNKIHAGLSDELFVAIANLGMPTVHLRNGDTQLILTSKHLVLKTNSVIAVKADYSGVNVGDVLDILP